MLAYLAGLLPPAAFRGSSRVTIAPTKDCANRMSETVVITGMGVCASNGVGVPAFREALRAGRSGIGPIRAFDASALRSREAAEAPSQCTSATPRSRPS